jgi:hypothetical protein
MSPYVPQFNQPTPEGFRDVPFVYYYDGNNTPQLNSNVAASSRIENIPLPLQRDADFYWRGFEVIVSSVSSQLFVKFRDNAQNFLFDDYIRIPELVGAGRAAVTGQSVVTLEPEIFCPAGGTLWLFLSNSTLFAEAPPVVVLYGVKRLKVETR